MKFSDWTTNVDGFASVGASTYDRLLSDAKMSPRRRSSMVRFLAALFLMGTARLTTYCCAPALSKVLIVGSSNDRRTRSGDSRSKRTEQRVVLDDAARINLS
jgi:hypothetical protein